MKILLLSSTNDPTNGYGNITNELVSYLSSHAIFRLLLPENEPMHGSTADTAQRILPPYIFNVKTPRALKYLTFGFDASGYDVIHSLFEFPYALIAARLARKYRKPLIIGTQGTYAIQPLFWRPERWLVRWAYDTADVITAPSAFTRDNIVKYSGTRTPVRIIHNAVNFGRFQRPVDAESIRSRYSGKKLLLTVGGLKPRKGQDIVIRALGMLRKTRDDFHYLIVGAGKMKSSLESLIRGQGLEGRVTFSGQIAGDELVRHFHACDAYVHTPILVNWQFEGFGIVYLEASACAKPIVAADSGGVRDAVLDGRTGLIVPEGDVVATAAAIERIMDDDGLSRRLGLQGLEYARAHTWDDIGRQFMDLYGEVTENAR